MTNVSTLDGYPRLRASGPALNAGARACDAVLRLLDSAEPNPPAYNLLCRYLALLDDPGEERAASLETALSFRLKLALAAGFAPELASCAHCGEAEHLSGFSGAAGGVVCASCEGGRLPALRGCAPLHGRRDRQPAGRGAQRRRSRHCARSSGPCGRRSSITRTCSFDLPREGRSWRGFRLTFCEERRAAGAPLRCAQKVQDAPPPPGPTLRIDGWMRR